MSASSFILKLNLLRKVTIPSFFKDISSSLSSNLICRVVSTLLTGFIDSTLKPLNKSSSGVSTLTTSVDTNCVLLILTRLVLIPANTVSTWNFNTQLSSSPLSLRSSSYSYSFPSFTTELSTSSPSLVRVNHTSPPSTSISTGVSASPSSSRVRVWLTSSR